MSDQQRISGFPENEAAVEFLQTLSWAGFTEVHIEDFLKGLTEDPRKDALVAEYLYKLVDDAQDDWTALGLASFYRRLYNVEPKSVGGATTEEEVRALNGLVHHLRNAQWDESKIQTEIRGFPQESRQIFTHKYLATPPSEMTVEQYLQAYWKLRLS